MIVTVVLAEIPTGAIADMLGKKYTLAIAFFLGFVGNVLMGITPEFSFVSIGVIIASLGSVLHSGTFEALIYDSLLSNKEEKKYQKILGNISSIKMITLAVASIIGGFLYRVNPGLPFMVVAFAQFIAMITSLFLTEPPIDSEVFSLSNYTNQTIKGFHELFKPGAVKIKNIFIILMTMLVVMNNHVLIDSQLVAQGWSETQLGIIVSIMYLAAAFIGQMTSVFSKKIGDWMGNIFAAMSIAITMITIPYLGILIGTTFIMMRSGLLEIFNNSASTNINKSTKSKYRATTLSTYSMLSNIPYILGAFLIGKMMDYYSVHMVTASIGVVLLFVCFVALGFTPKIIKEGK